MAVRRRAEALGFDIPRLEPDDAFVERLAGAASASRPSADARRPLHGLRVGLATAGVVGLTVGGAWAAGNLVEREDQAPGPPPATESNDPIRPEPSTAPTGSPTGDTSAKPRGHRPDKDRADRRADRDRPGRGPGSHADPPGRPDRPGDRGKVEGKGNGLGRPDELPGKGKGPGDNGQGKQHRAERADSGGPQGNGGGRRSDRPR